MCTEAKVASAPVGCSFDDSLFCLLKPRNQCCGDMMQLLGSTELSQGCSACVHYLSGFSLGEAVSVGPAVKTRTLLFRLRWLCTMPSIVREG